VSAEDDAFLARWSRRKIEARRAPEPESVPAAEPEELETSAAGPGDAEASLTPEEIEALPKIEDLTSESDLGAFLKKGVPEALRNAALRRMWSVDPAIRDYVGDARDYAWDWNVPGGVPGNGPLAPRLELSEEVKNMFSEHPGARHSEVAAADSEPADAADGEADANAPAESQFASTSVRLGQPPAPQAAPTLSTGIEPELRPESTVSAPPRRHGGAVPT
jgi:hypothetical protein